MKNLLNGFDHVKIISTGAQPQHILVVAELYGQNLNPF